jgi:general secretion pathway protein D
VKTTLLILFAACFSVWAQTSSTDLNGIDDAARDAALRRAMRAAANSNAVGAGPTLAANTVPSNGPAPVGTSNYFPAAPNTPTALPTTGINPSAFAGSTNTNNVRRVFPRNNRAGQAPGFNPAAANPVPGFNPAGNQPPAFNPATGSPVPSLPAAPAATPAVPEEVIGAGKIDFPQAPLDAVLDIYAELVGRTILHGQLPPVQVTLKTETALTRTEAIQALDSVLAMNGITMVPIGDKFVKAVQGNQVFQTAPKFLTHDAEQLPEADQYITYITQLKFAKPSELVAVLAPFAQIPNSILAIDSSQMLVIRDYAGNVKRMLELIKQIDVTVPLDYDSEVIPIKYAKASDIASALSSLGGGTGTSIGHSAGTGTHTGTGMGMGMGAGSSGFGSPMGTGTLGNSNPGGYNQNQQGTTGASPRSSSFGDRLNAIVRKAASQGEFQVLGQTKIISDERTNSLLVFAGKEDMKMIKSIVEKLDIVLAQVLIESIIMEVSLDSSHSLGFSYLQNPASASHGYFSGLGGVNNGTFLNANSFASASTNLASSLPSGFSYWANFGNDFSATMTAIAADSRINVLSRPRIQTSHGVPATIQVGQNVPMVSGTYFGGVTGVGSSSQYQQQFVGIQLSVTPLINPDGLVVMDIQQQVQQLGPNYTIDGNQVPSTTQRSAQATVSVKDRDTIILGGMISSTKNKSNSGVPILKDIPGLGALFRSSSVDNQRVELIVLIRPTVLPTPEAAALVATHERARLPGVKAAEAEERRDEIQRLKEADKIKVPDEKN